MVTVSTDEICAAIKAGFNDTRAILEPAGVLSIAGMTQYVKTRGLSGCQFVAVTSGANIDFARLRFVSERADSHERLLAVEIDENPGAFLRLNRRLDAVGVRITEFSYRYANAQKARVHLSFHSPSADHAVAAIRELQEEESPLGFARGGAYQVLDLSDNELAKVHTRYLAGGRARGDVQNERLYRFEFPDRPRALATFLEALQSSWNISLFHYRNHGADVGRVLVGFQVPEEDHERFQTFLNQLAYVFHEETDNQMYQEFML
ncbi:Tryptophan synthase beta subunit-like PLP-dependent enzyme [Phytophthora cactorum]|nr:Tryptophan synthase beta subunit-like PLP-dependent enzyme [Phytophthora cactorum]